MKQRCTECGGTRFRNGTHKIERTVANHLFVAEVSASVCESCGEAVFDGRALQKVELQIAARLAEAGVTSGDALRFMRKAMGIPAQDLAELLGVRRETVSRWEAEKSPVDRLVLAALHELIVEKQIGDQRFSDYLASLRKPRKLPRIVRLNEAA